MLVSTVPLNSVKSFSSPSSATSSSSLKRDELMDVGLEFMTNTHTATKPSYPSHVDSTTASRPPPPDNSSAYQVFPLPGLKRQCIINMH